MPDKPEWIIEKFDKHHDRDAFSCGIEDLDTYLQRYASQNEKAGVSQHFVAVSKPGDGRVLGYYALSASSISFEVIPDDLKKRLPRYPIPVAHMGRLAVDQSMQGKRLGIDMLVDALARIARVADDVGIHAVEVVAINDAAKQFYLKYGFTELKDDPYHLYLSMKTVRKLGLI